MNDLEKAQMFISRQLEEAYSELYQIDKDWNEEAYFEQSNICYQFENVINVLNNIEQ